MAEIIAELPESVARPAIQYPGVMDVLLNGGLEDEQLLINLRNWM
jgi:hypothetical protein